MPGRRLRPCRVYSVVQRGEAHVARDWTAIALPKGRDALHEGARSGVEEHAEDLGVGAALAERHRAHVEVAGGGVWGEGVAGLSVYRVSWG